MMSDYVREGSSTKMEVSLSVMLFVWVRAMKSWAPIGVFLQTCPVHVGSHLLYVTYKVKKQQYRK